MREELDAHLALATEYLVSRGVPPQQAEDQARARFRDFETARQNLYRTARQREAEMARHQALGEVRTDIRFTIEGIARDLRLAARGFRRVPAFAAAALMTLALGIGATTTVLSLAYNIWLRPLPYADPARLVTLRDAYRGQGVGGVSSAEIEDFRTNPFLGGVAGFSYGAAITKVAGEPVRLVCYRVTSNLFEVLGVRPILGRGFVAEEGIQGRGAVVVISHRFWNQRLGSDPAAVGKSLELFGSTFTIIGVMPKEFQIPSGVRSDLWIPSENVGVAANRGQRYAGAVARLKPAASLQQAQAGMAPINSRLAQDYPDTHREWTTILTSISDETLGSYRAAFTFLLGTVGLLLLIACANIASLFLARNSARHGELAVRVALGATRGRLTRQLFIESLLLSAAGGVLGILAARLGTPLLVRMLPPGTPRLDEVAVNLPVLGFAVLLSGLAGILCAIAPAWHLSTNAPHEWIKGMSRTVVQGRHALQQTLVIAQVALSLMLMVGAGLMLKSFFHLTARDHGYDPQGLLTMSVTVPFDRYGSESARAQVYQQITGHIARLPTVESVGEVNGFPGSGLGTLGFGSVGTKPGSPSVQVTLHANGPDYFRTMRTPLISGRAFTGQDRGGTPHVLIVNQALAAKLWPGESPIGKSLVLPAAMMAMAGGDKETAFEVVGVAGDMRLRALQAPPEIFIPTSQATPFWTNLVIRTRDNPSAAIEGIRHAITSVEPDMLIENVVPMDEIVSGSVAMQRAQSTIVTVFGALAALLSSVGLYGLLSHLVSQRLREIGVRLALGARRADVFKSVVSRGMVLASIGIAAGSGAAYALVRAMRTQVFGLATVEPGVFVGAIAVLLVVSLAGCYFPAWRATRIDPLTALR